MGQNVISPTNNQGSTVEQMMTTISHVSCVAEEGISEYTLQKKQHTNKANSQDELL